MAENDPIQVLDLDGNVVNPDLEPEIADDELRRLYTAMVRTRVLDERAMNLQRTGRIGFWVKCIGQEASHIGAAYALRDTDWIFPTYRDQGILFLRGAPLHLIMSQAYGNADDITQGRQMPVHYSFRAHNFVSISSPIGTQIIQAAGAAIAARIKGDDTVVMTFMGDGATSSNDFHSGMNFAAVRDAPCVFVCENNHWAISVPVEEQLGISNISLRAAGYGMPGHRVDGNDLLAVIAVARRCVEFAREGQGPSFIENVTFRIEGHSSSDDPSRYRSQEVVDEWKKRDPIDRFQKYLANRDLWDEAWGDEVRDEANEEIGEAIKKAEAVEPPPTRSIFEHVYAEVPAHLEEQYEELAALSEPAADAEGEFPL